MTTRAIGPMLITLALLGCGTSQPTANEPGPTATATATAVAERPSAVVATRPATSGAAQEDCCAELARSVARLPEGSERQAAAQSLALCNAVASSSTDRASLLQMLRMVAGSAGSPFPLPPIPGLMPGTIPLDCLERASSAAPRR
ncbi:MAG: hypothetical protein U0271_11725 [Polyangiaceae bacterium]